MLYRLRSEVWKKEMVMRNNVDYCAERRDSAGALNQGARFPASLVTVPVNGERGGGRCSCQKKKKIWKVTKWRKRLKKPNLTVTFP